jgi:Na+/glutamate symporter
VAVAYAIAVATHGALVGVLVLSPAAGWLRDGEHTSGRG